MNKLALVLSVSLLLLPGAGLFCQSVNVTTPDSSDTFCIGDSMPMAWQTPNLTDNYVEIYLRNAGGTANIEVIAEHTDNDGIYSWTIPKHIKAGTYTIAVKTVDSGKIGVELDNYVWNDKKSSTPIDDYNHAIDAMRYGFTRLVVQSSNIWA